MTPPYRVELGATLTPLAYRVATLQVVALWLLDQLAKYTYACVCGWHKNLGRRLFVHFPYLLSCLILAAFLLSQPVIEPTVLSVMRLKVIQPRKDSVKDLPYKYYIFSKLSIPRRVFEAIFF